MLLMSAVVVGVHGMAQAFGIALTASMSSEPSTGFHDSHIAGYLGLLVPLAHAGGLFGSSSRSRRLSAAVTALLVANVALSSPYAGWAVAAFFMAVLTSLWTFRCGTATRPRLARAAQIALLGVAIALASLATSARLEGSLDPRLLHLVTNELDRRISVRPAIAGLAVPTLVVHPWWAVGAEDSRYAAAQRRAPTALDSEACRLHETVDAHLTAIRARASPAHAMAGSRHGPWPQAAGSGPSGAHG